MLGPVDANGAHGFVRSVGHGRRRLSLNERQWELLCSIQDMLGGILQNMDIDEYHAPAPWLLENLWHSIEAIKGMESS